MIFIFVHDLIFSNEFIINCVIIAIRLDAHVSMWLLQVLHHYATATTFITSVINNVP